MTTELHGETWEREIDRRARLHLPSPRLDYRPVEIRRADFQEACLGFIAEAARQEASRCIQCPEPQACLLACPLHNDVPSAIWEISQGNFLRAARIYRQTSNFPELCGRLCPDELLCAGSCGVGKRFPSVRLGRLEAFAADLQRSAEGFPLPVLAKTNQQLVAVIGSGPAGLTASEELARYGHPVIVFDQYSRPGGALMYGIPRFRLPHEVLESKISQLEQMGIQFMMGAALGRDFTVDDLFTQGFRAVLLATGAGKEPALDITGLTLEGVIPAREFLMRVNMRSDYLEQPLRIGSQVVIYGCNHAAVDSARSAVRSGARQVMCIYPGTEMQMLCRMEDKLAAQEEGVVFHPLVKPVGLSGDEGGRIDQVACQQMRPKRVSGRITSEPVPGAMFSIHADTFIVAPELGPDADLSRACPGVQVDTRGWVISDPDTGETSRARVFAAGDNTGEQHLAVLGIAQGRRVAKHIHALLCS